MSSICICVICGLPASGKTSICRQLMQSTCFSFIHVCYDAILDWAPCDNERDKTVKVARKEIVLHVEACIRFVIESDVAATSTVTDYLDCHNLELLNFSVAEAKKTMKPVVFLIDDNMQYRGMRYEYYQLAKKFCTAFCIVSVTCPFETCCSRNENRCQSTAVAVKSMQKLRAQIEPPGSTNAHWEKRVVVIDTSTGLLSSVENLVTPLITDALLNPEKDKPEPDEGLAAQSREINVKSLSHQADLILRKLNKTFIQSDVTIGTNSIKQKALRLTQAKKQILNDLGDRVIDLTAYVSAETGCINIDNLTEKLESLLVAYSMC